MKIELTAQEARVLGCLLEKEVTTPEQYPLSINSLASACNQKSNREPVMNLDESMVQQVVDGLMKKYLVSDRSGYGGRVTKYKHVFCNTEFGVLKFTPLQRAILCELLIRGPQSGGELRTRCNRLTQVEDINQVDEALKALKEHGSGPFVVRLPRASGSRDSRYAHLLSGPVEGAPADEPAQEGGHFGGLSTRAALTERVLVLEVQVEGLQKALANLEKRLLVH